MKRCAICNKYDTADRLSNCEIPILGGIESTVFYHRDCFKNAFRNAEKYTNNVLELVIEIYNNINEHTTKRDKLLAKCKLICEKLKV